MTTTAFDPKRRALGKGLDSLLPRATAPAPAALESEAGRPLEIELDLIDRNPYQTRSQINEDSLGELAASIKTSGVLQPILVRPLAGGRYQLIAGERRWRASQLAGKATIPAILRQVSDEQAMEITIVENLQRTDLNPMEQARAFDRLGREFNMTQEQISIRTGKDRASIGNFLRLLKLPPIVQDLVESGQLSFGHARALLALEGLGDISDIARKIMQLSLSVRQTEQHIQDLLRPKETRREPKPEPVIDPNVRDAQERLQRVLGLKVTIEDRNGRGRVIIEYARLEDFDTLLEQLGKS